jgi:hypothetical protein
LHFGGSKGGDDHHGVRIVGGDCDLTFIYGMDFPSGRGPVGRSGSIEKFASMDLGNYFPTLKPSESFQPWIRIAGEKVEIRGGSLLIRQAANGVATGEIEFRSPDGRQWSGEFALPFVGYPSGVY